jgi:hypothetical protein
MAKWKEAKSSQFFYMTPRGSLQHGFEMFLVVFILRHTPLFHFLFAILTSYSTL